MSVANIPYRRLDTENDETWLLTLNPPKSTEALNKADKTEELHCRIDHYPLRNWRHHEEHDESCASQGCFVALSYTWSDENDLDGLIVDGYIVPVQSNLKKALEALSRTGFIRSGCRYGSMLCASIRKT